MLFLHFLFTHPRAVYVAADTWAYIRRLRTFQSVAINCRLPRRGVRRRIQDSRNIGLVFVFVNHNCQLLAKVHELRQL
jgi:hypothetical protein